MALTVADEPEVAAACTTALLAAATTTPCAACATASAPRSTAASRSAVGPDADQRTLSALEMTFFGALVKRAAATSPTTRSPTG